MAELKYKVGDRVRINSLDWYNENKNKIGIVELREFLFGWDRAKYCGKIMEIGSIKSNSLFSYYIFVEDDLYGWTDDMIECKVEEEIKPKFKVGDKVKDKNDRVWFIVRVSETFFDISSVNVPNSPGYFVPMVDQDYYELAPDIELPKTFEECVHVLEGENRMSLEQMNTFRKLIDARNAYWKLYGEEKGLGKPWEPDWNIRGYYAIARSYGNVVKTSNYNCDLTFVFPTEEMRDKFYENFKEEIEICKEFL